MSKTVIFAVVREGVERHEILMITTNGTMAIERLLEVAAKDTDSYHRYNLYWCFDGDKIDDVRYIASFTHSEVISLEMKGEQDG